MPDAANEPIDAMPTKSFFVDMLIRDIPLERAVLDLVDNCIDGATRLRSDTGGDLNGLWVEVTMATDRFQIADNCGGFSIDTARDYAFRFGRARSATTTPYSIGQFGVGMKRALFKFGRQFKVASKTATESWSVDEDVDQWEVTPEWHFSFRTLERELSIPPAQQGTVVAVSRLRPEVVSRFGSDWFRNSLREMIRTHQRQFIGKGLEIKFNGTILSATDLNLLVDAVTPAVEIYQHEEVGKPPVDIRLIAGVGSSNPSIAGWYVVCNGRVVLAADRTEETGWGRIPEQSAEIPKYHNQYARFRGVAFFQCVEASLLPWNTTKTGVDSDSAIWRTALEKMIVMARSVMNFLNAVDGELREQGHDGPYQRALAQSTSRQADMITAPSTFRAPDPTKYTGPRMRRIAYSKPVEQVDELMEILGLHSAKAVGEETFDSVYLEKKSP